MFVKNGYNTQLFPRGDVAPFINGTLYKFNSGMQLY